MPDAYISGNDGYVLLDSGSYNFQNWKLSVDPGNKKFFAFGSRFQRTLPGGVAGTITADGPYNAGNMPLSPGVVYEFHLGYAVGVEVVVNARLGPVDYGNAIGAGGEAGGTVGISADSEGTFTIVYT